MRGALIEAAQQKEFNTPQLIVDASEKFFQIVKGASAFIWTRLQHLEIWTSQEFWDTYFFAKGI